MTADERAIRALIEDWLSATRAGDLNRVLALMADDVLFMVPGREPFGKKEFAEQSQAMARVEIASVGDVKEVVVHGELAYARTHLTVTMTPPGAAPIRRAGHTLSVFRKQGGAWLLVRDANLLGPQ